jgi:hypothetical protein
VAKMAIGTLKPNPLPARASEWPVALGTIVGAVLCAPTNPISTSPIMPESFITYTDFKPNVDLG